MRRPVFADPKTDFVFQRIFGSEDHKPALIGFLNDILELDGAHRVTEVSFLPPELRPKVSELKYSIVDVKCVDARGVNYVVEMQVLNVEAFEKQVVYNVAKAYTNQLGVGDGYPELNDIIGISVCDFELWPRKEGSLAPMLSRWRMQVGLSAMQFVFMELPKWMHGARSRSRARRGTRRGTRRGSRSDCAKPCWISARSSLSPPPPSRRRRWMPWASRRSRRCESRSSGSAAGVNPEPLMNPRDVRRR